MQMKVIIVLGCIVLLYRIFLRVRRTISWQQLKPGKMGLFTVLFTLIGLLFLVEGSSHAVSVISDTAGILIGIILAYYSARMTRFEQREGRWYYRTNTWIGSLVTFIFLGRIIYRVYDIYSMAKLGGVQEELTGSSRLQSMVTGWSAGLLFVMFAYYAVFNIILILKQKHLAQPGNSNS